MLHPKKRISVSAYYTLSGAVVLCVSALMAGVPASRADSGMLDPLPPLIDAVVGQDAGKVQSLLEQGADPNIAIEHGYTALHFSVGAHVSVPERQAARLRGGEPPAPEDTTILEVLLRHGANPDAYSEAWGTPLTVAVFQGRTRSVRVLLEAGADPDGGRRGWSPLMVAAYHCYPDIAALLLGHDAATDYSDVPGRTALSLARERGCADVANLLPGRT